MDQVKVDAVFQNDDIFDRQKYAQIGMKLIESYPDNQGACSIAVDAPWGGKSTFLHMWINELNLGNTLIYPEPIYSSEFKGKNVLPIYYNAWENDFSDSAMAPLLYTICAELDKKHNDGWLFPDDESPIVEFISSCSGLLLMLLTLVFSKNEVAAQAAGTAGGMTVKGLLNLFIRYSQRDFDEPEPDSIGAVYDKHLKAREEFREALTALVKKCGGVYIFIDELDRCKPTFAIDTLETIKHYFDIPGLAFVFGIDMMQLSHAISQRYGERYDSGGYLSKFFDHHILLPTPSTEQMIRYCNSDVWLDSENCRHLDEIFRACKVSPREIPRIMKASGTLLAILIPSIGGSALASGREFVFLLVSMRYRLHEVYKSYIGNEAGWNIYMWSQEQSFFKLLSFFAPYMTKSVSECRKGWNSVLHNRTNTSLDAELYSQMSSIGCAIIEYMHPSELESFSICISHFMEHVYT